MMPFSNYETLVTSVGEHADRVATIAINRPDARNALNEEVRRELKDALTIAEDDDEIRVVVLTGAAESNAFIAGADVKELRERDLSNSVKRVSARGYTKRSTTSRYR